MRIPEKSIGGNCRQSRPESQRSPAGRVVAEISARPVLGIVLEMLGVPIVSESLDLTLLGITHAWTPPIGRA